MAEEIVGGGAAADASAIAAPGTDVGSVADAAELQDELSILDSIDKVEEKPADEAKPETKVEGEEEKPEAKVEEKVEGKTEEQKAADAKAAETKAAEEKAAADAAEGKAVKALREAIDKDAGIKAALEKNPSFRNKIFADARRSEELGDYKKHFATAKLAERAIQDVEDLSSLETLYEAADLSAVTASGKVDDDPHYQLLQRIYQADLKRDPKTGEPVKDANGDPVQTGNFTRFFTMQRRVALWPKMREAAGGDEEKLKAVELVMQMTGDAPGSKEKVPAKAESSKEEESRLTDEEKGYLAKGKDAERQQREADSAEEEAYAKSVTEATTSAVDGAIRERVDNTGKALTKAIRQRITDETRAEIGKIAKADPVYQRLVNSLFRRANRSDEAKKEIAKEAAAFARERMNDIIRAKVKEFSEQAVDANKDKHRKLDEQKGKGTEVRGGAGVAAPARQDFHGMVKEANQLMQKLEGRPLKDTEIVDLDESDLLVNLRRRASEREAAGVK